MRRYRFLIACLCSWAAGLLCALSLAALADDEVLLKGVIAGYKDGSFLADEPIYQALYETTSGREVVLRDVRRRDETLWARFEVNMRRQDGEPVRRVGVAAWDIEDGRIVRERSEQAEPAGSDLALSGQAADVATTVVGVSAGLAEANPLLAPMASSPAGFVVMGALKAGAALAADEMSYESCVGMREGLGTIGFAAGAWNLGILAAPPVAILAGVISGVAAHKAQREDAIVRCLPALGPVLYAELRGDGFHETR